MKRQYLFVRSNSRSKPETRFRDAIFVSWKIGKRQPESKHGEQAVAMERFGDGVNQQYDGKSEYLPETLLGKMRQQSGPRKPDNKSSDERNQNLDCQAAHRVRAPGGRTGALGCRTGEKDEQQSYGEHTEDISERRFDQQDNFDRFACAKLLKDRKDNSAAGAAEHGSHEGRA